MFGLGPWELAIILVVVIFFFGGKRLGDIGGGLGKSISEFKKAIRDDSPNPNPGSQEPPTTMQASEAKEAGPPAGLLEDPSAGKKEAKSA